MSTLRQQAGSGSRAEANRHLCKPDEHEWAARQIAALRSGRLDDLDEIWRMRAALVDAFVYDRGPKIRSANADRIRH
jgi:hypothetical protein